MREKVCLTAENRQPGLSKLVTYLLTLEKKFFCKAIKYI